MDRLCDMNVLSSVRGHACEVNPYGKVGGCAHLCLLSGSYKSRSCRCRTGFSLGSDGQSCKSQYASLHKNPIADSAAAKIAVLAFIVVAVKYLS